MKSIGANICLLLATSVKVISQGPFPEGSTITGSYACDIQTSFTLTFNQWPEVTLEYDAATGCYGTHRQQGEWRSSDNTLNILHDVQTYDYCANYEWVDFRGTLSNNMETYNFELRAPLGSCGSYQGNVQAVEYDPTATNPPTAVPTPEETAIPTPLPTPSTTQLPTPEPSPEETPSPTPQPTFVPTALPTLQPTQLPTIQPIPAPTQKPTSFQSAMPVPLETTHPSSSPTLSPQPQPTPLSTQLPTQVPTQLPTQVPTHMPTSIPIPVPTQLPTQLYTSPADAPESSPESQEMQSATFLECWYEDGSEVELVFVGLSVINSDIPNEETKSCYEFDFVHDDMCEIDSDSFATEISVSASQTEEFASCSGELIVVSQVYTVESLNVEVPVNYNFLLPYNLHRIQECKTEKMEDVDSVSCRWFDEGENVWKTDGCYVAEMNIDINEPDMAGARCECTHLTVFAILRDEVAVKGNCILFGILGHDVWLIYFGFYVVVIFVCLGQIRILQYARVPKLDVKYVAHVLTSLAALFNGIVDCILYSSSPRSFRVSLEVLASLWAPAYIITFWLFAMIATTWAHICHADIGKSPNKRAKLGLIAVGIMGSVLIFVSFILIITGKKQSKNNGTFILAGSMIVSGIFLLLAVTFLFYGVWLVKKLWGMRQLSTNTPARLRSLTRIVSNVCAIISVAFILNSSIVLISGAKPALFYENFLVFQSIYTSADILLLLSVVFLYRTIIKQTLFSKISEKAARNPQHEDVEMKTLQNTADGTKSSTTRLSHKGA